MTRRIEGMVAATEAEHLDEELKQLLRGLVPDFHPHPTPPNTSAMPYRILRINNLYDYARP